MQALLSSLFQNRPPPQVSSELPDVRELWWTTPNAEGVDSQLHFSVQPLPGDECFQQWRSAMAAVARLPTGVPAHFRRNVWLALAENHIKSLHIDWEKTVRFAFNERTNPDDNKLGTQIVKDLHRTGYSDFNGEQNEEERALLKRVLLAYARWNKTTGYCQGFNVLMALILDVVNKQEADALKIMIFLVDYVLPAGYFSNNLRALSIDLAVFRELLRSHLPYLSSHLDRLHGEAAQLDATGQNYEPPLTNMFTMQWFLTMFATCLPRETVLRVWDSVLLDGAEVLLRTAIIIWRHLSHHICELKNANEFYSTMAELVYELSCAEPSQTKDSSSPSGRLHEVAPLTADSIVVQIYEFGSFPMPEVVALRERLTYNITPLAELDSNKMAPVSARGGGASVFNRLFRPGRGLPLRSQSAASGLSYKDANDSSESDEEQVGQFHCFAMGQWIAGVQGIPPSAAISRATNEKELDLESLTTQSADLSARLRSHSLIERACLDYKQLERQYHKLQQRQKQSSVVFNAVRRDAVSERSSGAAEPPVTGDQESTTSSVSGSGTAIFDSPQVFNHLFVPKAGMQSKRNRKIYQAPGIVPPSSLQRSTSLSSTTPLGSRCPRTLADLAEKQKSPQLIISMETQSTLSSTATTSTNSSAPKQRCRWQNFRAPGGILSEKAAQKQLERLQQDKESLAKTVSLVTRLEEPHHTDRLVEAISTEPENRPVPAKAKEKTNATTKPRKQYDTLLSRSYLKQVKLEKRKL